MTDTTTPLTADAVRQMPAGRELDLRVAVAIGAMTPDALAFLGDPEMMAYLDRQDDDGSYPAPAPPRYSTDHLAAVAAVEAGGWRWAARWDGETCWFRLYPKTASWWSRTVAGWGDSFPLAVCRALLLMSQESP